MFNDWLLSQLQERGWSQADLHRASGLTTAAVSRYLQGRIPNEAALRKIARAFRLPAEEVFRHAGILPPASKKDELIEKIVHELNDLPEEARDEIYQYVQLRREISERKGRSREPKTTPAKP
jgi:transcriptional regulator with XRE-family HTH domain